MNSYCPHMVGVLDQCMICDNGECKTCKRILQDDGTCADCDKGERKARKEGKP